jgi:hypothetical protein
MSATQLHNSHPPAQLPSKSYFTEAHCTARLLPIRHLHNEVSTKQVHVCYQSAAHAAAAATLRAYHEAHSLHVTASWKL